jgi:stage III sporulation protein SpoIIIAA
MAAAPDLIAGETRITDNLEQLLQVLPPDVRLAIQAQLKDEELLEIVLDLGRCPEARFTSGSVDLTERVVDQNDLEYVTSRVGEFGKDNRAGIERTLHRISAIRNRTGRIVGLTCRIGRAVFGTIDIMRDVVESGKSILILGRPGVGKTTKLREVARVLSEEFGKRVVIEYT